MYVQYLWQSLIKKCADSIKINDIKKKAPPPGPLTFETYLPTRFFTRHGRPQVVFPACDVSYPVFFLDPVCVSQKIR